MGKELKYHIDSINNFISENNLNKAVYTFTEDNSLFCSIKTNKTNFYLEIFFDDNIKIEDSIVSYFKKDGKAHAFNGELKFCLNNIKKIINDE